MCSGVHLAFSDGGFVSLVPNSEFRVNDYHYQENDPGTEKLSMSLLKGGLRTVSGAIGKVRQAAYEMVTRAATMGIRGTEYTIQYAGNSVSGTVGEGRIAVCNAAGCIDVAKGQSYFVKDADTKPALSAKGADLTPRQPESRGATLSLNQDTPRAAGDPDLNLQALQWVAFPSGDVGNSAPPGGGSTDQGGGIGGAEPGGGTGGGIGGGGTGGGGTGGGGTGGGGTGGGGTGGGGTGGGPSDTARLGIGFQIIGITAPDVDGPMRGGVSEFAREQQPGGKGWGPGGNPTKGPRP
jgi:hypothetical protein